MSVRPPPLSSAAFANFADGAKKGAETITKISAILPVVERTNPEEAARLGEILKDWAVVTMRIETTVDRMIRRLEGRLCCDIARAAKKCTSMDFKAAAPVAPPEPPTTCASCGGVAGTPGVFFSFLVKERDEDTELTTKEFTTCVGKCADFALRVYCYANFGERIRTVPKTPIEELRREFDACERTVCDKDI